MEIMAPGIAFRSLAGRSFLTTITNGVPKGAAGNAGGASGSCHVLNRDLVIQRARHVLAHDAGDHVGWATRREGAQSW